MEPILTLIIVENILLLTVNKLQKERRRKFLLKWIKGECTMKELLWLKKQPWFQKAFTKVIVSDEKKNE